MNEMFKITMLGDFSIEYNDSVINEHLNRSKKAWTLLEYLVFHKNRFVSQDELVNLLWSNSKSKDPVNALKVLMHRVRAILDKLNFEDSRKIIIYNNGAYGWNPKYECCTDLDEFQRLIAQSDMEDEDSDRRIELLLKAESIYKGHFLQKKQHEDWVIPISNYFSNLYNDVITKASELLYSQKQYKRLALLCHKALMYEPQNEALYVYLIKSLVQTGNTNRALEIYHEASDLFLKEFGITPSEDMTSLYRDIVRTVKSPEMDISVIKNKLDESDGEVGCFFCEYEFFKMVYRLEARTVLRTGESIYLLLMTVSEISSNDVPPQKVLNRAMEALQATIQYNLRSGDVFARHSVNQFLMLLPMVNEDSADMVARRIVRAFHKDYPNIPVLLKHSMEKLTPKGVR